jgi:hypothetical protein
LRKNIILKALQTRIAQEVDSKGVVGGESVRRTPVSRWAAAVDGPVFGRKANKNMSFETCSNEFSERL